MEIRPMCIDDYEALYQLWLSCPGMGLNDLDDSREGIAAFLERNPATCFVAAEGETIAGCILVGTDGRRAYVYHTAVHQGIGHKGPHRDFPFFRVRLEVILHCAVQRLFPQGADALPGIFPGGGPAASL